MAQPKRKFVFGCCFCGETIPAKQVIGIALVNPADGEFQQQFWAHKICFKVLLSDTAETAFEEATSGAA